MQAAEGGADSPENRYDDRPILRGAMWASRPARCNRIRRKSACIKEGPARDVEDAVPYDLAFPVGRDAHIALGFGRRPGWFCRGSYS